MDKNSFKKMPQRPKQHQAEDNSILEFQKILPIEWVFREKDKDYGIDGEVEIFDNEGNATGKIFYVQLKSTKDKLNSKGKITYYLKNSTANYYSEIQLPVLFVLYSETEKTLYARWINNFTNTTSFFSDKDESPVVLKKENIINIDFFSQLHEKIISNLLNASSYIVVSDGQNISNNFEKILIQWFSLFWSDILIHNSPDLEHKITIYIKTDSNKINIEIDDSFFGTQHLHSINYSDSSDFLWFPNISFKHINNELVGLFLWISQALLSKYNDQHIKLLVELLRKSNEKNFPYENNIPFIIFLAQNNEAHLLRELFLSWLKQDKKDLIQLLIIAHLHFPDKKWFNKLYKEMLLKLIEESTEEIEKGTYYYNLANFTRVKQTRQAIKYYMLSRKHQPDYLNRSYWFHELGGCFFVIGHYGYAVCFYEKSLELDEEFFKNHDGCLLLFDSALLARNFKKAEEYLEIYEESLTDIKEVPSEFVLKATIIEWLIDEGYDLNSIVYDGFKCSQINSEIEHEKISDEEKEKRYIEALNSDPLNERTHFNYGMLKHKKKDKMAYIHFLISALLNKYDFEAWTYSILLALESLDPEELSRQEDPLGTFKLLPEIINAFYTIFGSNGLEEFKTELNKQEQKSIESRSGIYNLVMKIIKYTEEHGLMR